MMNIFMNRVAQLAVALVLGLFLVPFAHAGEPALNAKELGIVEAVLNICGKVDPAAAGKLRERIAALTKGASNDAVARARAGDEYRKAYDSIQQLAGTGDERNAKKVCTESVAPNP
jgi:hypothetical protein